MPAPYKGVFEKLEEKGVIHGREKVYKHQEYPKTLYFEKPDEIDQRTKKPKVYQVIVSNWSEEMDANTQAGASGANQVIVRDPRQIELEKAKKVALEIQQENDKLSKELAELKAQRAVGVEKPKATKIAAE